LANSSEKSVTHTLYLTKPAKLTDFLIFSPSLNLTSNDIKNIATEINLIDEPFSNLHKERIIEGISGSWNAIGPSQYWSYLTCGNLTSFTNFVAVVDGGNPHTSSTEDGVWLSKPSSNTQTWSSVAISSDGTKIAACHRKKDNTANTFGMIYTSNNSGATWTMQSTPPAATNWSGITMSSDGTKLMAIAYGGTGTACGIYYGTYTGTTWTFSQVYNVSSNWSYIVSDSALSKVIIGNKGGTTYLGTYTTSWSFVSQTGTIANWSYIAGDTTLTNLAAVVSGGVPAASLAAAGTASTYASSYIYTSSNSGTIWTQQTGSGSRAWSCIASSSNGQTIVAAVYGGGIWLSTDFGVTWSDQKINAPTKNWISICLSANGSKIVACASNDSIYNYLISTPVPTPTPSLTITPSYTPSQTITPSYTPSHTITPSYTPSHTITPSYTPTQTITPSYTPSQTITPTYTPSQTMTPTYTPIKTMTPTYTIYPTPTNSMTTTPTTTRSPITIMMNISPPNSKVLKVSDPQNYYVGDLLKFADGSIYKIVSIDYSETYVSDIVIEGNFFGTLTLVLVSSPSTSTSSPTTTLPPPDEKKPFFSINKAVSCGPLSSNKSIKDHRKSIFYARDCLGYYITNSFFKTNSLILKLDADDDGTILKPGYYKLTI